MSLQIGAGTTFRGSGPGWLRLVLMVLACGTTGCWNRVVEITNEEQATLGDPGEYVGALAVSRDGQRLASSRAEQGFPKRCVKLWDLTASKDATPIDSSMFACYHLEFSSDGKILVFAGIGGFGLVDVETRKIAVQWRTRSQVMCATLTPDGRTVIAAEEGPGDRSVVGLWDIEGQKQVANQPSELNSWGFDLRLVSWGDGTGVLTSGRNLVIVGTDDRALLHVRVFDASGKCVRDADETELPREQAAIATLKQKLPGLLPPHALMDDERAWVILHATPIHLRPPLRRKTAQQPLATLDGHRGWVQSLAFSSYGKTLASAGYDGTVKLWDFAASQEIATLTVAGQRQLKSVAFSPDGKTIASAGLWSDSPLRLWDVATRRLKATLSRQSGEIVAVVFTPNGKGLSGSGNGTAVLWDVQAERPLAEFVGGRRSRGIYSVVLTPDGKTLLAGCGDGTIKRWEMPADRQWK